MNTKRTEERHPLSAGLHNQSPATILQTLLGGQRHAAGMVEPAIPQIAQAAELCASAIRSGGKVGYAGAGSAGLTAMADALELAGTFGIPADQTPVLLAGGTESLSRLLGGAEDDTAAAAADFDASGITSGDALICVSASGTTPYTLTLARRARECGAQVIGVANVADSPLLSLAHIPVLLDTGPEVVAGSTRMGAATAQKIALNMLSALMAVHLGHVHDGYMVNVIADNEKLRQRGQRMVEVIAGVDPDSAKAALVSSSGAVKPAILIAKGAGTLARAEALLADEDHILERALHRLGKT